MNQNILVEFSCEWSKNCDPDQTSFKAYLSRWMAASVQLAPFLREQILPKLQASAKGAAQQCIGGDTGSKCGRNWNSGAFDGFIGVGEQMSALAAVQATLIDKARRPVTMHTGGTSKGDPNAGNQRDTVVKYTKITQASRVAAGILTMLVMIGMIGGAWWVIDDGFTPKVINRISGHMPLGSAHSLSDRKWPGR